MKRLISAACVAMCSVASAGAQSMGKEKMANMDKMPKGAVMVTGCVAPGSMADHYMLSNATMSHGAMDKDAMGKDTTGMKKDTMGGDHAMSYALAGGDLKAHVGHKVEVTGTVAKPGGMGKMKDKDSMAKSDMAKTSTLTVQSVKMLSESCS